MLNKIPTSISKAQEINNALVAYWLYVIPAGLGSIIAPISLVLEPTVSNSVFSLLFVIIFLWSAYRLVEVYGLQNKLLKNPEKYDKVIVPKPIITWALHWPFPK
jgi:hypothetical protein